MQLQQLANGRLCDGMKEVLTAGRKAFAKNNEEEEDAAAPMRSSSSGIGSIFTSATPNMTVSDSTI